jgi:hypothetical protein
MSPKALLTHMFFTHFPLANLGVKNPPDFILKSMATSSSNSPLQILYQPGRLLLSEGNGHHLTG